REAPQKPNFRYFRPLSRRERGTGGLGAKSPQLDVVLPLALLTNQIGGFILVKYLNYLAIKS
ncbi:MAG TPA: hypothetical protein VMT91_05650, partial [Anaerolineales bacterium]|nr:hypothetical protein [Anaerolineales bacterium]